MDLDYVKIIQDVGFPIAVAAFVLVRLNGKVGKLADAMVDLTVTMKAFVVQTDANLKVEQSLEELRTKASDQIIIDAIKEAIKGTSSTKVA
jgi:hypothetical protein